MKLRLKCKNCDRYFVKLSYIDNQTNTFIRKCNWCSHTMDITIYDFENFKLNDLGLLYTGKILTPKPKNPATIITDEMKEMLKEFTELAKPICKEYGVAASFKPSWNSRLKTTAGYYRYGRQDLELSTCNFHEFGKETIYATFLHELAHHICYLKYDKPYNKTRLRRKYTGHKEPFKIICHAIGGSMNCRMAGEKYKSSSEKAKYCNSNIKPRNHTYTCPTCDIVSRFPKQKTADWLSSRACRTCKTVMTKFEYWYDN